MAAHSWRLVPAGSTGGQEVLLEGRTSFALGRSEKQDICLSEPGVSREHAVLTFRDGIWHVRDLRSTHGTHVDGKAIQPEVDVAVREGSTLTFGPCLYTLARSASGAANLRTMETFGVPGQVVPVETNVGKLQGQIREVIDVLMRLSSEATPKGVHRTSVDSLRNISGYSNIAFICEGEGGQLQGLASLGDMVFGDKVNVSTTLLNRASESSEPHVWRKSNSDISIQGSIAELKLEQVCIAPVMHEDKRFGFIVMDNREARVEKVDADVAGNLLWLVANSAAARLFALEKEEERLAMFRDGLVAILRAVEEKDPYTRGHSDRVAVIALEIAQRANWSGADQDLLLMCGKVHDIGKIGIPDKVLQKEGKLDDEEFAKIKEHPERGWRMLHDLKGWNSEVLEGIRHHHERFGGGGYPHGLSGQAIPRFARVLALADVFDALTSNRSYRTAHSIESALRIIRESVGSHFDPELAKVFFSIPESKLEELTLGGQRSWNSALSDSATR